MIRLILIILLLVLINACQEKQVYSGKDIRPVNPNVKKSIPEPEDTLAAKVMVIIKERCVRCHRVNLYIHFPAGGVALHKSENIKFFARRIWQRAFIDKNMPLVYQEMPESERELINQWYQSQEDESKNELPEPVD